MGVRPGRSLVKPTDPGIIYGGVIGKAFVMFERKADGLDWCQEWVLEF